jgi:hypothetical protein
MSGCLCRSHSTIALIAGGGGLLWYVKVRRVVEPAFEFFNGRCVGVWRRKLLVKVAHVFFAA